MSQSEASVWVLLFKCLVNIASKYTSTVYMSNIALLSRLYSDIQLLLYLFNDSQKKPSSNLYLDSSWRYIDWLYIFHSRIVATPLKPVTSVTDSWRHHHQLFKVNESSPVPDCDAVEFVWATRLFFMGETLFSRESVGKAVDGFTANNWWWCHECYWCHRFQRCSHNSAMKNI